MTTVSERSRKAREPVAWLFIAVSIGFVVTFLVKAVTMLAHDHSGVFAMARSLSGSSLGIGVMLALLASVLLCRYIHPVTPHASLLGRVAATVVAVAAGLDLLLAVLAPVRAPGGALGAGLGLFGDLLAVAVKILVAWMLVVMTRDEDPDEQDVQEGSRDERETRDGEDEEPDGTDVKALEPREDETEEPAPAKPTPVPSWPEGVGAVWTRAGDAANGAGATGWGDAGDATHNTGWGRTTGRDSDSWGREIHQNSDGGRP